MIEVILSKDDEDRLNALFDLHSERRMVAESCDVSSKERAMAFREVTAVMRQIEDMVPPATVPWR
jgi:hypothetical protein